MNTRHLKLKAAAMMSLAEVVTGVQKTNLNNWNL